MENYFVIFLNYGNSFSKFTNCTFLRIYQKITALPYIVQSKDNFLITHL